MLRRGHPTQHIQVLHAAHSQLWVLMRAARWFLSDALFVHPSGDSPSFR